VINFYSWLKALWNTSSTDKLYGTKELSYSIEYIGSMLYSDNRYYSKGYYPCGSFFIFKTKEKEIIYTTTSVKMQNLGVTDIVYKVCPYIVDFRLCTNAIYADDKRGEWLAQNATGIWYHSSHMYFRFENEEDAVLFKLTWS
jgi:hypothetical protein